MINLFYTFACLSFLVAFIAAELLIAILLGKYLRWRSRND